MQARAMPEEPREPGDSFRSFVSFAETDTGPVRSNNEDAVHADDQRGIYFVVDGMGGHAAGEEAARIAKERLRGRLERPSWPPEQRIREAITLANNAIAEAANSRPEWQGMACVLTVALLERGIATVGHVGDTRLYKIRNGSLEKITRDHSPVGELEDNHLIGEEEAMAHSRRNEVYRDVGSVHRSPDDPDFIDLYRFVADPDSAFLICSDGLTDEVRLGEIESIIAANGGDGPRTIQGLLDRAKEGSKDNISAVFVRGPEFGRPSPISPEVALAIRSAPTGPLPPPDNAPASVDLKEAQPALAAGTEGDQVSALAPLQITTAPPPQPAVEPSAIRVPERASTALAAPHFPVAKSFGIAILWMAVGAGILFLFQYFSRKPALPTVAPKLIVSVERGQIRPPDVMPSIQAALREVSNEGIIHCGPGVYNDSLTISRSVIIEGNGCIISASVSILSGAHVRLSQLKILGRLDSGFNTGIMIRDADVDIHDVEIVGANGPAIELLGSAHARIVNSTLRDNGGPGLSIRGTSSAEILTSQITHNGQNDKNPGPGVEIRSTGEVILSGNLLADNGRNEVWEPHAPTRGLLDDNFFGLDRRPGRASDVRVLSEIPQ
jgi:serine/threonine protein phosphatase PrpC